MAEKGGKGFSLPTNKPSSLKGKDDNSTKPNKTRKVHIDFEDVSDPLESVTRKSNGKGNTPVSKGESGKVGKGGDKTASGGKHSAAKAPPHEFKIDKELPKTSKCLMDCEAAEILQGIQDKMVALSADPAIKIPMGLVYALRHGICSNPLAARQILQSLKKNGVSNSEMCMIANLKVESADEIFALVPSLKGKKGKLREPLKCALEELAKLESLV